MGQKNITREIQRLQREGNLHPIFKSFLGASSIPITFNCRDGKRRVRIKAFLEQGTRDTVGTKKIVYKHLIDGLTAWTGGFTLDELQQDLTDILNGGVFVQDSKGARITVHNGDHNWIIGLRSNYGGNGKTTISTICSSRNSRQTQELVNSFKSKMSGTNATSGQKTNTQGGQPDEE